MRNDSAAGERPTTP